MPVAYTPGPLILAIIAPLASGCLETRWECTSCVGDVCASSLEYNHHRSESLARCDAGEQLCYALPTDAMRTVCGPYSSSTMFGCDDAFLAQLTTTCSTHHAVNVPLPGVK